MKILTSQLLFTCFLFALYIAIRVYRKWDLRYQENRIFSGLCVTSAIWSLGFWGINIQTDIHRAYICRCFGMVGVFAFLIIGQYMILHLSVLPRKPKQIFTYFSYIGVIILIFLLSPNRVTFRMSSIGMTYSFAPDIWNNLYVFYSVMIAVNMGIAHIYTLRHTNFVYIRVLMKKLLLAESIIVLGMLLDTIFPLIGKPAFPGSTIGQFVGLLAMYDALSFINHSRINISNMSKYVYSSLSLPVLVYDHQAKLQIVNDAASSFLDLTESLDDTDIDKLFDLEENNIFSFEGNRKAVDSVCRRNGIYCNLSINKIINDYGDLIGYIIITTDLSERMQAFKQLEEATQAATSANQAKTTFLANMSHEIRTPMHAIIGFSELVLQMELNDEVRSHVEDIRISSQNLLAIINDILDITKIESGKIELLPEEYDTIRLLDDVSLIISQQARQKGLDFRMTIDPNMPNKLYGDKIRIRGILINLLNNAVKYTRKGYVSFELNILEQTDDNVRLAFKISDSGIGIQEKDLVKIFNSFERLEQNPHYRSEGSGLGLAIANGYAKLMGGTIQVKSEYGKGSTFTVMIDQKIIDASVMKQEFAIARKSVEPSSGEKILINDVTVLVVDDNYINLRVAQGLLSSYGLTVETAASGQDAIDLCRQKHYPLIFMDQMMPEMDGITAMKQIRRLDSYYSPEGEGKIIVLTADAIRGVRERLLQEGFDEYLGKPMNLKQLESIFQKYLPAEKFSKKTDDLAYLKNSLPMVDVNRGMDTCGHSIQEYLNILKITYTYGEQQLSELQGLLTKHEYENYTIKVHSMKSTSLSIGAEALSRMALSLELAGKERLYSFIEENHPAFHQEYQKLLSNLHQVLCHFQLIEEKNVSDAPVLEDRVMNGILTNIRSLLNEFDFGRIFEILEEIDKYQTTEKQNTLFKQLKILMDDLNVEEITLLLDSYQG